MHWDPFTTGMLVSGWVDFFKRVTSFFFSGSSLPLGLSSRGAPF